MPPQGSKNNGQNGGLFVFFDDMRHFRKGPSSAAVQGVYVRALGIRESMKAGLVDRRGGTGDYLFMYLYDPEIVNEGKTIRHDREKLLVIWPPGEMHRFGNARKPWLHSWMHCEGGRIAPLLQESRLPLNRIIPLPDPSVFEKYLIAIYNEITAYRKEDAVIVENLFHNLVRELSRQIRGEEEFLFLRPAIQKAKAFVEAHYTKPLMVNDLASMAAMSESHFRSEYRKCAGLSPMAHVIELRMLEAAMLVTNRNLRIREVAAAVGFDDLYYFSKRFKKRFGVSPRAYRLTCATVAGGKPLKYVDEACE
jgi:AraC family transcriptional regulator, arabinose operon regulatory protein